jgi:hypothetical protein
LIKPLEIIKTGLEKQTRENVGLEPLYFLQGQQKTAQQGAAFSHWSSKHDGSQTCFRVKLLEEVKKTCCFC